MRILRATFALALLSLAFAACSGEQENLVPACVDIAHYCSRVDPGDGFIHQCRQLGENENADPMQCVDMRETCLSACVGALPDGG